MPGLQNQEWSSFLSKNYDQYNNFPLLVAILLTQKGSLHKPLKNNNVILLFHLFCDVTKIQNDIHAHAYINREISQIFNCVTLVALQYSKLLDKSYNNSRLYCFVI